MKNDIFIQERNIMRVIAGSAKRLQLKTIDGLDTRPTTDRIKETLFNMISHEIADFLFFGFVQRKWSNRNRSPQQRSKRSGVCRTEP